MIRKQITIFLLLAVLLAGFAAACTRQQTPSGSAGSTPPEEPAPPSQEPAGQREESLPPRPEEPDAVPLTPSLEQMMETIAALCREPRPLGSPAELSAAQFLRERLEEYGYQSRLEPFFYSISDSTLSQRFQQAHALRGEEFLTAALPLETPDGGSQNVTGRQPGEESRESILVLSAHYDSTPGSLGVLDNASGVAVVLEAARILAANDLPFSLRIVFFGGEEEILIGSRQYVWGMTPDETNRIIANISVDTLAYTGKEEFIALTPLVLSQNDPLALAAASPAAAALLADSRVSPVYRSHLVGDHMAFSAAGIDSVHFGQSMDAVDGIINSPLDTWDFLVPELLPAAADLLIEAVQRLARQTSASPRAG